MEKSAIGARMRITYVTDASGPIEQRAGYHSAADVTCRLSQLRVWSHFRPSLISVIFFVAGSYMNMPRLVSVRIATWKRSPSARSCADGLALHLFGCVWTTAMVPGFPELRHCRLIHSCQVKNRAGCSDGRRQGRQQHNAQELMSHRSTSCPERGDGSETGPQIPSENGYSRVEWELHPERMQHEDPWKARPEKSLGYSAS